MPIDLIHRKSKNKTQAYLEAENKIEEAQHSGAKELDLRSMKLTELPESIGELSCHLETK